VLSPPDDVKTPDLADVHVNNVQPPETDTERCVDVPISVDGEVSVPAVGQLDGVPKVDAKSSSSSSSSSSSRRSSQDVSELPDLKPVEVPPPRDQDENQLPDVKSDDDDDEEVIVKVSAKPVCASLPPSDEVVPGGPGDEGPVDGSLSWSLAPTSQRDRCVRRTEPFQPHGYAVLVTPAMLKQQATVLDEFDNGRRPRQPSADDKHDQDGESSSSSSRSRNSSEDRLSGQYYFGINNFNAADGTPDAGGRDTTLAETDHQPPPPSPLGSDGADQQPLDDEMRS